MMELLCCEWKDQRASLSIELHCRIEVLQVYAVNAWGRVTLFQRSIAGAHWSAERVRENEFNEKHDTVAKELFS